ncbi:MarR family winged helix-turn-helix transcriptional regulator [Poriferisphaera sp. WC338]|uniref:MarR family winged helix-turn-helix transcriptional regulator n=1 Tax=Poriferisphaera sp. WC338 TaxID=3425129 RepID=UPI003D812A6E
MATDKKRKVLTAKCTEAAGVCACFHFRKVSRAVTQLYDQSLQPAGLRSTQFVILVAVHLYEPVGVSALARALVMDRTTLMRNLRPLEEDGLLVKEDSDQGGRSKMVRLTPEGEERITLAIPYWEAAQKGFVEKLGVSQWDDMLKLLNKSTDAARLA